MSTDNQPQYPAMAVSPNPNAIFKQAEQAITRMMAANHVRSNATGEIVSLLPDNVEINITGGAGSETVNLAFDIPNGGAMGPRQICRVTEQALYDIPLVQKYFKEPSPIYMPRELREAIGTMLERPNNLTPEHRQAIMSWSSLSDGYHGNGAKVSKENGIYTADFNIDPPAGDQTTTNQVQQDIDNRLPDIRGYLLQLVDAYVKQNPAEFTPEDINSLNNVTILTDDNDRKWFDSVTLKLGILKPDAKECDKIDDKLCSSPLDKIPNHEMERMIEDAVSHAGPNAHLHYGKLASAQVIANDLRAGFAGTEDLALIEQILADSRFKSSEEEKNDKDRPSLAAVMGTKGRWGGEFDSEHPNRVTIELEGVGRFDGIEMLGSIIEHDQQKHAAEAAAMAQYQQQMLAEQQQQAALTATVGQQNMGGAAVAADNAPVATMYDAGQQQHQAAMAVVDGAPQVNAPAAPTYAADQLTPLAATGDAAGHSQHPPAQIQGGNNMVLASAHPAQNGHIQQG